MVLRAWIVLAAASGHSNASIAHRLGVCEDTVRVRHRPLRPAGSGVKTSENT
jgi:DNA-directed RNA polymerase specialized sigma24 family protein